MTFSHLIKGVKEFGSSDNDICSLQFNCDRDSIEKNVVLASWWQPLLMKS